MCVFSPLYARHADALSRYSIFPRGLNDLHFCDATYGGLRRVRGSSSSSFTQTLTLGQLTVLVDATGLYSAAKIVNWVNGEYCDTLAPPTEVLRPTFQASVLSRRYKNF